MLSRRFRRRRGDDLPHGQLHPMTCPVCETTADPAAQVGPVAVCGHCGMCVVLEDAGGARRATAADTTVLSDDDLQTLRHARGRR